MATQGMPMPAGQHTGDPTMGVHSQGSQQEPETPSDGQATQLQMLLARWFQVAKQMAASDPRLASGAEKVSQGIQEMQAALLTPPRQTPLAQQPAY